MDFIVAVITSGFEFFSEFNYKWTILFYALIIFLIYLNRKKFEFEMKFVAIMRTKIGLVFMEKIATKYREIIKLIGYWGIGIGYVGMIFMTVMLLMTLKDTFLVKGTVGVAPVIPGVPIAGTDLVIPLVAGWISLFVIMVIHEFSHGVVARAHKIKIKSSGIAFFGPLLAAFVEPDEKQLSKQPDVTQYSMLAAGPFSNLLTAGLIFVLMMSVFSPITGVFMGQSDGVIYNVMDDAPALKAGMTDGGVITYIDDTRIMNVDNLSNYLGTLSPEDTINIRLLSGKSYDVQLEPHPSNAEVPRLGIEVMGYISDTFIRTVYNVFLWIQDLFKWIFFLSLGIGLINLFPIFITDGSKMLKISLDKIMKDEKKSTKVWFIINKLGILLLLILLIVPVFRWITGL